MKEIELKHSADGIALEQFNSFCINKFDYKLYRYNLGVDSFYVNPNSPDSFFRIREDEGKIELTFKKKIQGDNIVRVEHNIVVNDKHSAQAIVEELGYTYAKSINKVNHVHTYPWYVLSYYICYDANMREIGRFIEIEMREDCDVWTTEHETINELKIIEKTMKSMGISEKTRIKESLYELFIKGGDKK